MVLAAVYECTLVGGSGGGDGGGSVWRVWHVWRARAHRKRG